MGRFAVSETPRVKKKSRRKKLFSDGIVYLMRCILDDGTIVIKIGVTGRNNIYKRLMENINAFFTCHRYIPHTTLIKYSRTADYFLAEKKLHNIYKDNRYLFDKKFQGFSEYFVIDDEDALVDHYLRVMQECSDKPINTRNHCQSQVDLSIDDDCSFDINDLEPTPDYDFSQ